MLLWSCAPVLLCADRYSTGRRICNPLGAFARSPCHAALQLLCDVGSQASIIYPQFITLPQVHPEAVSWPAESQQQAAKVGDPKSALVSAPAACTRNSVVSGVTQRQRCAAAAGSRVVEAWPSFREVTARGTETRDRDQLTAVSRSHLRSVPARGHWNASWRAATSVALRSVAAPPCRSARALHSSWSRCCDSARSLTAAWVRMHQQHDVVLLRVTRCAALVRSNVVTCRRGAVG